jgi:hypothetical protein
MPAGAGTGERAYLVRDVLDEAIRSRDRRRLGRVADIELVLSADGTLRATNLCLGVETHLRRLSRRVSRFAHRYLRGRFEKSVGVGEVEELGPTVRLRGMASDYDLDSGDQWVARKILRFIPGNGGESK